MSRRIREGNNPKRRIAGAGDTDTAQRKDLLRALRYVGSAHHKYHPELYGLPIPSYPRKITSVCDDLRSVDLKEAVALFRQGINLGMVSSYPEDGIPKYVWAVDGTGEVFEAKVGSNNEYHGYRLGENDSVMKEWVTSEWRNRQA